MGMYRTTGLEHDETGKPCAEPANRVQMMARRAQRMRAIADQQCPLEQPEIPSDEPCRFGLVGWGRSASVAREAHRALSIDGVRMATVLPALAMAAARSRVQTDVCGWRSHAIRLRNQCEWTTGSAHSVTIGHGIGCAYNVEVISIGKDDGTPLTQHEISDGMLSVLETTLNAKHTGRETRSMPNPTPVIERTGYPSLK